MRRLALPLCLTCAASAAWAQPAPRPAPDEEWVTPFAGPAVPDAGTSERNAMGPELPPPPPPPKPAPRPQAPPPRPVVPEEPNTVSVYGAPSLGQWKRGIGVYMGFPLLGARFSLGLLPWLDAGVAFDSMYGVMNDFRLHLKWQFLSQKNWTGAVAVEGGPAYFAQTPQAEGQGPRWLTGRRDWNLAPGIILSYRGDTPRSPRLFLDVRYALAFDTEPYEVNPLGGVPPSLTVAGNVPVRAGAEMPFSAKTSFLFVFGFDVHGRQQDSVFMIDVSVGIVTSI